MTIVISKDMYFKTFGQWRRLINQKNLCCKRVKILIANLYKCLQPVALSTSIADSGTIFSGVIPWNVNGALFGGTLGIATLAYAPYAFLLYLTPLITLIIGFLFFRKDRLPSGDDAATVYGKEPKDLPSPKLTA